MVPIPLGNHKGGVLWQGRSIRWQGAHVQHHNEGNIGVLVMGNFDLQSPTAAQLTARSAVLREARSSGKLAIHSAFFEIATGLVTVV